MKQYFVGVDLGSANVVMVVGSRDKGSDLINIEGISVQQTKKSIKHGHISTTLSSAMQNLSSVILSAKQELEQELGIKIEQGYFSLGDIHTRCVIVEDMTPVKNKHTGAIGNEDVNILRQLIGQIKTESYAESVLSYSALCYFVNGTKQTTDPIGLQGSWLKARYMLTVGMNDQQNYLKGLHHRLGMEIQGIFVGPTITYPLLVSKKEAEEGVVIVDIGAEVTDVTIVRDNRVQYFRSLPFGAELIDADLKSILPKGCNVTKIKHIYGKCISSNVADNEVIKEGTKEIIHRNIATVIEARLMDFTDVVGKVVAESGFGEFIPHGYVLTGGCSSLAMIEQLFERELSRPCRKAETLYGIKNSEECEITPGQHAAVAIMLKAAELSPSYVKELDLVQPEPQKVTAPAAKAEQTKPAAEPTTPVESNVDTEADDTDTQPTTTTTDSTIADTTATTVGSNSNGEQSKSKPKDKKVKRGSVQDRISGLISRFLGGDDKEK